MERLLQWLDELDDLYGAAGLLAERMRGVAARLARTLVLAAIVATGFLAALREPPLGLAIAILLFVFLLYRSVTQPGFATRRGSATA